MYIPIISTPRWLSCVRVYKNCEKLTIIFTLRNNFQDLFLAARNTEQSHQKLEKKKYFARSEMCVEKFNLWARRDGLADTRRKHPVPKSLGSHPMWHTFGTIQRSKDR